LRTNDYKLSQQKLSQQCLSFDRARGGGLFATLRHSITSVTQPRITAEQLDLSPTLMAAANSSGGVMGKMIDAQSIVVASTATRWYGHEGEILRFVFWRSIVLASLVELLVFLQAYVDPFTRMTIE
jgi:hypothetical protein